jgi:hypothetical protein
MQVLACFTHRALTDAGHNQPETITVIHGKSARVVLFLQSEMIDERPGLTLKRHD